MRVRDPQYRGNMKNYMWLCYITWRSHNYQPFHFSSASEPESRVEGGPGCTIPIPRFCCTVSVRLYLGQLGEDQGAKEPERRVSTGHTHRHSACHLCARIASDSQARSISRKRNIINVTSAFFTVFSQVFFSLLFSFRRSESLVKRSRGGQLGS